MALWKTIRFGMVVTFTGLVIASASQWPNSSSEAQLPPTQSPSSPQNNPTLTAPDTSSSPIASDQLIVEMLKLGEVGRGDVVYALGSGDGRSVITAVQTFGAKRGVAVESDPDLISVSKANATKAGVADRVQFLQQDPYKTDFREASVVTLYTSSNEDSTLRSKLLKDLKPGTRIVSNSLVMGNWLPDKVISSTSSQQKLYYWVVPADISGDWHGDLEYVPGRSESYTIRFVQQFQQVKGDVIVKKQKYYLSKISLKGDRLTFSRTETIQGQQGTAIFNGRVEGDTLKGVIAAQWGPLAKNFPIVAKRAK